MPDPFSKIIDYHAAVFAAENSHYYGPFLDNHSELLSKKLRDRLIVSKTTLASEYIAALNARDKIYHSLEAIDDYILFMSFSNRCCSNWFRNNGIRYFQWALDLPWRTLSFLPILTTEKIPLGLQLVGKQEMKGNYLRQQTGSKIAESILNLDTTSLIKLKI